jgi:hypothetical protein
MYTHENIKISNKYRKCFNSSHTRHIHTYIHMNVCTYIYTYKYRKCFQRPPTHGTYIHRHIHTYGCMHVHTYECMHVHTYIHTHMLDHSTQCAHLTNLNLFSGCLPCPPIYVSYIHTYIHTNICTYTYTYTHTRAQSPNSMRTSDKFGSFFKLPSISSHMAL